MSTTPDGPRASRQIVTTLVVIVVLGILVIAGAVYGFYRLATSTGFVKMADEQFGDQHLKTAVALIELHKVRTGRYPTDLNDLKYTGQWDALAIQSVRYVRANDGLSYFVEVKRGWIGKPSLTMPEGFWHGTGYNPKLDPNSAELPNQAADRMPGSSAPGKSGDH